MIVFHSKHLVALALAAVLASGLAGCGKAASEDGAESTLPKNPVPVRAVKAARVSLRPSVELVGTLVTLPEHTTTVSPQVGGWVQKVSVVEGATVRAGDELVLLDSRLVEVEAAKAAAQVAEREAIVARLKRGYLPQEVEIARHEADKCKEQVDSARAELGALKPLREKNEVPEVQYQRVESSLRVAAAGQAAAEAKLKLLLLGTPREEIAEAVARLAMAKAELATAKLNLELCRITSPIAGTVTQLSVRQGMFAERSAPLLTIADLSRMFMQVRIPSLQRGKTSKGAPVEVRLTSRSEEVFHGTVARISGQADPATGDVDAFVEIPNDKERVLCPGLACRARLWLPPITGVLAVPVAAVADRAGTPVVSRVRDGRAREVEVAVGIRTAEQVQITRGLSPGDWVITEGGYSLPEDCPVRVINDAPSVSPPALAR
jgi:multidrug efflux pump subunit AcrA (membrane-fusion protein)